MIDPLGTLPTIDEARDKLIASKVLEVSDKLTTLGISPSVVLSRDANGAPRLLSDGKKRDDQIRKAINAWINIIRTRDSTFAFPDPDQNGLPSLSSIRDPDRDNRMKAAVNAGVKWVNAQQPAPEPVTVKVTGPASVVGGDGKTTQIVATTTGPVASVVFGIETGPNVTAPKDLSIIPASPSTPNRFEFTFFLSPMWTPVGTYQIFARAIDANGQVVKAILSIAVTQETAPSPTPVPAPVPSPVPADARSIILSRVGPTLSVADTIALGGVFKAYEDLWNSMTPNGLKPLLPDPSTDTWENNYYDRGVVFYARYARTLDPVFLQRGHTITLDYRTRYLEPNDGKPVVHWAFPRGLELHYLLTGDELSRTAVARMYAQTLCGYTMPLWGDPKIPDLQNTQMSYMENRIQARVLQVVLCAMRLGASATGEWGTFGPTEWPTEARKILNQILSTQNANGSYSWVQIAGGQENFMVGILNDVLIDYWNSFEKDPRIQDSVQRANEYLWTTQWLKDDQAFQYFSAVAPTGGFEPAGDLNGLLIASFGWLYHQTGDVKWRERGDEIMAGLVAPRWTQNYTGSKQFNQAFVESHRYLGWR